MTADRKDFFMLHLIVLLWGFTAILGVLISIPSVEIVFHRTLLAALGLGIILLFRKHSFSIGRIEIVKMLATGLLIAAHWILFFGAAKVSTASICLAGMATTSLWTSIIEPIMTNRKIKFFEVALGLVVIFGLYIIFRFEFDHVLGLSMALGSALLAAVFTVINGKFTKRHHPYMINFYEMVGAFLGTVLFLPFYSMYMTDGIGLQLTPTGMDFIYILILALLCTVFAYSVSIELMKRISAFFLNLTVNLEPVYGIILAVIVFGEKEKMSEQFYIGTLVILLSVLSYPILNRLLQRRPLSTRLFK
jgi:drug/metabolite transporter (DMT)-like permease